MDLALFVVVLLLSFLLAGILVSAIRSVPHYSAMYEGLGDKLPRISQIVFHNYFSIVFLSFPLLLLWIGQHVLLIRSIKLVTFLNVLFCFLSIALIAVLWFATNSPFWALQQIMPS